MTSPVSRLTPLSTPKLAHMLTRAHLAMSPQTALLQAAHAGRFALAVLEPPGLFSVSKRDVSSGPVVVALADGSGLGPAGWTNAVLLLRWATHVVIVAGDRVADRYDLAVRLAFGSNRVLLIRTTEREGPYWESACLKARAAGPLTTARPWRSQTLAGPRRHPSQSGKRE